MIMFSNRALDLVTSLPIFLEGLLSRVLLSVTLIVVAGVIVTVPAYLLFRIYQMLPANKREQELQLRRETTTTTPKVKAPRPVSDRSERKAA